MLDRLTGRIVTRPIAGVLILLLLLVGGRATAQPNNSAQMESALQALSEGRNAEARDLFAAVVQADPRNVQAWHGQGLALLRLGEPGKALPLLERAAAVGSPDRSLAINLASALLKTRSTMRAIKLLRDHLVANPRPLDEPALRALEAVLHSADANARRNRLWIEAAALAESYSKTLESARPGWKRWGSDWRSAAEVDNLRAQYESNRQVIERLDDDIARLQKTLEEQRYELQQMENRPRRGPGRHLELAAKRERIRGMQTALDRQLSERKRLADATIEPRFDTTIEPVGLGEPPPAVASSSGADVDPSPTNDRPVALTPSTQPGEDEPLMIVPPTSTRPAPPLMTPPGASNPTRAQQRDAVAVTLTRDLVVVPLESAKGAAKLELQLPGNSRLIEAMVVRQDAESGLALLRVGGGIALRAIPLANRTDAGATIRVGFSGTDLFQAIPESVNCTLSQRDGTWTLDGTSGPSLTGAALCRDGRLVGIVLRGEDGRTRVIDVSALRRLLADDLASQPIAPIADPRSAILHFSATHAN